MKSEDLIVEMLRDDLRSLALPLTPTETARVEAIVAAWEADELTRNELAECATRAWFEDWPARFSTRLVAAISFGNVPLPVYIKALGHLREVEPRIYAGLIAQAEEDDVDDD